MLPAKGFPTKRPTRAGSLANPGKAERASVRDTADPAVIQPGHLAQKRRRIGTGATSSMGSERKSSRSDVSTSAQLRHAITRGQSRDKVSNIDPAAAPLGTDDEAAGRPPSRHEIDLAAKEELRSAPVPSQPLEQSPIVILLGAAALLAIGIWVGVMYSGF
jgi:hypothetical protein